MREAAIVLQRELRSYFLSPIAYVFGGLFLGLAMFFATQMLLQHFRDAEAECKALLGAGEPTGASNDGQHKLALPAYDQCIKASHIFNLLDARGVISVTERQSYILRVRELAKACCGAWLKTAGGGVAA